MSQKNSILGSGPSFPLNVSESGGLLYTSDMDRINHSLFLIFETPKGSRLMNPEFGSDIHEYRFDPLDDALLETLRYTITQDIYKWEPRISLTSIEFFADEDTIDQNTVYISVSYRIINTTIDANYVYPYRMETYDTTSINI